MPTHYDVFGDSATFTPLVGSASTLTVIIDDQEPYQPSGSVQVSRQLIIITYSRSDIDRKVLSGEMFTVGSTTYTVRSMANYPDAWTDFEGKCVVE